MDKQIPFDQEKLFA